MVVERLNVPPFIRLRYTRVLFTVLDNDVDINAVVVDDNLSLTRREIYSYLFFSTKSRVAVKDLCHYWWITNFFRKLGRFQNEMN